MRITPKVQAEVAVTLHHNTLPRGITPDQIDIAIVQTLYIYGERVLAARYMQDKYHTLIPTAKLAEYTSLCDAMHVASHTKYKLFE